MGRNDQGIKMEWWVGKQCSNTEGAAEKLRTKVEKLKTEEGMFKERCSRRLGIGYSKDSAGKVKQRRGKRRKEN